MLFKLIKDNSEIKKLECLNLKSCEYFSFDGIEAYAKVCKVYDGDTVTILFDYHGKIIKLSCRLLGIDTPELRSSNPKEKEYAIKARDFLSNLINDKVVKVHFKKFDKYGRPLIVIYKRGLIKRTNINKLMIKEKYALSYDGGKKQQFSI